MNTDSVISMENLSREQIDDLLAFIDEECRIGSRIGRVLKRSEGRREIAAIVWKHYLAGARGEQLERVASSEFVGSHPDSGLSPAMILLFVRVMIVAIQLYLLWKENRDLTAV